MGEMSEAALEREGISELGIKALEDLIEHPPEKSDVTRYVLRMTSGTSGRAPVILAAEHKKGNPLGFERCRTLVVVIGGNNARLANSLFTLTNTQDPTRILVIDDSDLKPQLTELFHDLKPDAFRGFPSFIRRVGEYIGNAMNDVRGMKLSGEKWTLAMQTDLAQAFPRANFEIVYGITELGVLATTDCPHLKPDHYHPRDDAAIEIGNPDENGLGDVLISRTFYRTVRATRYKVGDIGRIDPEPCACGKMSFELLGRKGSDYLRVAGATLFREEFDRVASICHELFDDYRAEVSRYRDKGIERGRIDLSVFRRDGRWSEDIARDIAERFSSELFLTGSRTLSELVVAGYFEPLVVTKREEPFPFKSKEVKLSERRATS